MQIAFFSNGGFVAHKYRVPESACKFSVWFNRDGFATDARRIDSIGRAYPVTAKQWQHIERHKIAGLENATAIEKARNRDS